MASPPTIEPLPADTHLSCARVSCLGRGRAVAIVRSRYASSSVCADERCAAWALEVHATDVGRWKP